MRVHPAACMFLVAGLLLFGSGPLAAQAPPASALAALFEAGVPAKDPGTMKIGRDLAALYQELDAHLRRKSDAPFKSTLPLVKLDQDRVVVDAVAAAGTAGLRAQLEKLGMVRAAVAGRVVSGWLPISSLPSLAKLESLRFVRPAYAATRAGIVTSQGDAAMFADVARTTFGVDGSGVTVGVLSDSFDCLGGATSDLVTGDLPAELEILMEGPDCAAATDEGRAMMQIVHDVAPGARQLFHTAFTGQAGFAQGIRDLAAAGAQVVVDDVLYFAEPMFQDGIVAQAVDDVAAMGVSYFSAAGNSGPLSYAAAFTTSGQIFSGGALHDFDPGAGVDVLQNVTLPVGLNVIALQWKDSYYSTNGAPGASSDLDLLLVNDPPTKVLGGGFEANVGGDPIEVFGFFNPGPATRFNLAVARFSPPGTDPELMQYVILNGRLNEYDTAASTLYGHANAAGAEAVGAAPYYLTPGFGVDPAVAEEFSARGGTPILFDSAGLPIHEVRHKPEIVCPDGGNTTFFGFDVDFDLDGFPNFFGTSAAAPHAAGIAALLLELDPDLSPAGVRSVLESTAGDMNLPGFDFDTGYGFCLADQALASLGLTESCVDDLGNGVVCLAANRFEVSTTWTDGEDMSHPVVFERFSHQAAVGTFGDPHDPTILVKVTGDCPADGHWSVSIGDTSSGAGWELRVRDSETGQVEEYSKSPDELATTLVDGDSFPCD